MERFMLIIGLATCLAGVLGFGAHLIASLATGRLPIAPDCPPIQFRFSPARFLGYLALDAFMLTWSLAGCVRLSHLLL